MITRRPRPVRLFVIAGALLTTSSALACLWDHDTLRQETARFPTALELITGKFLRHSKLFYEWRVRDRLEKLKSDPTNLVWHDDLAAAYDKLGKHDLAIATMEKIEAIKPDRYETLANLGTFYFHAGQLEKGIPYIKRALEINPDAHFGRERYQLWLVEYILTRERGEKISLPLRFAKPAASAPETRAATFLEFVAQKSGGDIGEAEIRKAVAGVLGMMRFGNHRHPVLLEALGDLISPGVWHSGGTNDVDAKQLGGRAFLMAAMVVAKTDPMASSSYRSIAEHSLGLQVGENEEETQLPLGELEESLTAELAEADAWYAELEARERQWIESGDDPEGNFDRLYDAEPAVTLAPEKRTSFRRFMKRFESMNIDEVVFFVFIACTLGIFVVARYWPKPKTSARENSNGDQLPS